MKKYRLLSLLFLSLFLTACMAVSGFAATKKGIKSVTIKAVCTDYEAEDMDDDSSIEIVSSGTGYDLEQYEVENPEDVYDGTANPVVKIYLSAHDGYYFNITKASQIKLSKCKYKTAARQDSSTTLVVTVELTEVKKTVGTIEEISLEDSGKATWEEVYNAGAYELRIFRNDSRVGSVTVDVPFYDISSYFTREGSYLFKVRAIHKADQSVRGEWTESGTVYVDGNRAKANREAAEAAESAGEWIADRGNWKFRLPDGTFVANTWRRINKQWYYFLPDSHIARGWTQVEGAWYYFDPTTGALWVNTTTPDGYTVGIDGRRAE